MEKKEMIQVDSEFFWEWNQDFFVDLKWGTKIDMPCSNNNKW